MTSVDLLAQTRSFQIKKVAESFGFLNCRISEAIELTTEARQLEKWLKSNQNGTMSYMENHFEKRVDPRKLFPGAKSVIVLSKNYYPSQAQNKDAPQISKYAYGRDYHKIIRKQLKKMLAEMRQQFGEIQGRGFVDSAPVLEKAWATRSGLGWMGKHTNVISKQKGSFFFLAVLITDLDLYPDKPVTDHCGSCTACIDACPTEAITEPYKLDASRCISYLTIELKENEIPLKFKGQLNNWMFGCDICQDVCPWNRFSTPHGERAFEPKEDLINMTSADWRAITKEKFETVFSGSAVRRAGYAGLLRNIRFLPISSEKEDDEG